MFDPGRILTLLERAFIILCVAFIALIVGWAVFKNWGCAAHGAVQVAPAAEAIVDADVESLVKLVAQVRAEMTGVKASVQGDSITSWIYALGAAFVYPAYRLIVTRWRHKAACENHAEITKRILRQSRVVGDRIEPNGA